MDEKSRNTSSVCDALMTRLGDGSGVRKNGLRDGMRRGGGAGGRRIPETFQQRIQQPAANGFGQHVGDAVQKSLLLPFGLAVGGVGDDGGFGVAAAKAFDDPDAFDAHQIHVENAGGGQSMREQRLGFIHTEAMNDPVLLRIQTRANRFGEIWMRRQNQNGFHRTSKKRCQYSVAASVRVYSTIQAQRSMES